MNQKRGWPNKYGDLEQRSRVEETCTLDSADLFSYLHAPNIWEAWIFSSLPPEIICVRDAGGYSEGYYGKDRRRFTSTLDLFERIRQSFARRCHLFYGLCGRSFEQFL
ncbi:hypothetical protein TNCV_1600121 [Trichonephila clavipes]|nr:hypothetical protein TNCV_1600121 [Trichonephila clavipes]